MKRRVWSLPYRVTQKMSDHHLYHEQHLETAIAPHWHHQLHMVDVDKYIIIHPKFWAKQYTNICILSFCSISRRNWMTDSRYCVIANKRWLNTCWHQSHILCMCIDHLILPNSYHLKLDLWCSRWWSTWEGLSLLEQNILSKANHPAWDLLRM
jgi:hypothetical protein